MEPEHVTFMSSCPLCTGSRFKLRALFIKRKKMKLPFIDSDVLYTLRQG